MRMYPAPPMPQDVIEHMHALKDAGTERERLIGEMRGAGLHIVECIKLVRDLYCVDLGQAKRIVHFSDAWTDMREPAERLHDDLLQAAREEGWTVTEAALDEEHTPAHAA